MSACNRKRVLHAHEFAQHFGTANHRNTAVTGFNQFWVIVRNSRRINHQVRIFDVRCFVLRKHLNAKALQVINHLAFTGIGTAHHETVIVEHFGNTGHTGTTDTYKMKLTDTLTIINLH